MKTIEKFKEKVSEMVGRRRLTGRDLTEELLPFLEIAKEEERNKIREKLSGIGIFIEYQQGEVCESIFNNESKTWQIGDLHKINDKVSEYLGHIKDADVDAKGMEYRLYRLLKEYSDLLISAIAEGMIIQADRKDTINFSRLEGKQSLVQMIDHYINLANRKYLEQEKGNNR